VRALSRPVPGSGPTRVVVALLVAVVVALLAPGSAAAACSTATPYSTAVLAQSGLVGYWRLDDGAGTSACDAKGTNVGTYQGGFTLNQAGALAGDLDASVAFNGTTGDVSIPSATAVNTADTFSIEAWTKRGALGTNQVIASKQGTAWTLLFNTTNNLVLQQNGVNIVASTTTVADTTTWHHVVATKSGSTTKLYIDGVDRTGTVTNKTLANSTSPLLLGKTGTTNFFNGRIDEVALYNTALAAADVTNHFLLGNAACPVGSSPYGSAVAQTAGLVSYWRLGESSGTTTCDSKGKNPGTYSGTFTLGQAGAIPGDADKATLFGGTSASVSIPPLASLNTGDTFSIEAWTKRGALGTNQVIASKQGTAWTLLFNTTNNLVLQQNGVNIVASTTTAADTTTWHHVVATKSGSTTKLYIDGVDRTGTVTNKTLTNTTSPLVIGQSGASASYFKGTLDDVALYNVALSTATISGHYALTTPPSNTALPGITGTAVHGQTLTATNGTWTNSPSSYSYQWQSCSSSGTNCANVINATQPTYALGQGDVGTTLRVVVTATNAAGSTPATSAASAVVQAAPPSNTVAPSISGTTTAGQSLTVNAGTWTGTSPINFSYQWRSCDSAGNNCANIAGATTALYTLGQGDVGTTVRIDVTATNPGGAHTVTSQQTAVIQPAPPANTAPPTVSGTAVDGRVLTASSGTWTGIPTFSYRWQRCDSSGAGCADIASASAQTYTQAGADVGFTLRVVVTGANAAGSSSANSAATGIVQASPPSNSAPPTVSGTVAVGQTLSATPGAWSGSPTYAYQWQSCDSSGANCTNVNGARGPTLDLSQGDLGTTLRVVVTATNANGSTALRSQPTALVQSTSRAPSNTAPPSVSGSAAEGETLTAARGSWSGTQAISYVYQWQACDAQGNNCADVNAATDSTYALRTGNVGTTMRVVVTATNAAGGATTASSATATVQATTPPASDGASAPASAIRYVYDENGRLATVTAPSLGSATYGWDPVGNLLSITRRGTSGVQIDSLSPYSGPVGTRVAIYGSGFDSTPSANHVEFAGTTAAVLTATPTELLVAVPAGATSGTVLVSTSGGAATSSRSFTVQDASPSISGVSPDVASAGDTVTVTGRNFDPAAGGSVGSVNQSLADSGAGTSTSLPLTVPGATGSGRVAVRTSGGSAVGPDLFVPPSGYTPSDVDSTGRAALGDTKKVAIGSSGKIGMIVFDGSAGQQVSLQQANSTFRSIPAMSILKPDGTTLVGSGAQRYIDATTLPATGTYAIVIDPQSTDTGDLDVSLGNASDVTANITPGGLPVDLSTTAPGQRGVLSFSGTAGQRVSLREWGFNVDHTLTIRNPDGSQLWSAVPSSTDATAFSDVQTLPTTGTYTIVWDPSGTAIGSTTVALYDIGSDVSGTLPLTPAGAPANLTTPVPGRNGRFTFTGTAGQKVSVTTSGNTFPSLPRLVILKPDGTNLVFLNNANFVDATTLPVSGTYTLLVDPQASETGSDDLVLYDASDLTASIAPGGAPVTIRTTVPGQTGAVSFSGTAGQRVSLRESGFNLDHVLSIRMPDGSNLWSGGYSGTDAGEFSDVQTLPATGTYTIVWDPSRDFTGSTKLTLYDVSADPSGTLVPSAAGASTTFTTTVAGQNGRYSFSASAGQKVSVTTSANTFSNLPRMSILKPDGSTLVSQFNSNFIDATTLPVAGTYTLLVDPQGADTGSQTITLFDASDATASIVADGSPVTVATSVPGQSASVAFTGTAGQRVSLREARFDVDHGLTLKKPDGSTLWSGGYTGTDASEFSDVQTLPVTGTYTISWDPQRTLTGSTTLSLYNVPADVTGTLTPTSSGASTALTTTAPGQNARYTFSGSAGQRVSVKTSSNGYPSLPRLSLLRPDGSTLVFPTSTGYIDPTTLPSSGTYTVVVDPQGADTGSLTLTLFDGNPVMPTAGGTPTDVTSSTPGQVVSVPFSGAAGQKVSVTTSASTYPSNPSLSILKPDGTTLVNAGATNFIDATSLPSTGTYTLVVTPQATQTGGMTVTIYDASDVTGSLTPTSAGSAVTIATTAPGQLAAVTFSGTAGERVALRESGFNVDNWIGIKRADGTWQWGQTFSGATAVSSFSEAQVLPSSGNYTILYDPTSTATGSVTLTLYDVPPDAGGALTPTPTGATASLTTTVPGQVGRFTFTGTTGQKISAVTSAGSFSSRPQVSILKPDGSQLGSLSNTGFLDALALPSNGSYTLLVDPIGTDTGSADVKLYDASDSTGSITPGGAPVTVTTTAAGQTGAVTFSGTAGQRVSLRDSGSSVDHYVQIKKPDGTSLWGPTFVSATGPFTSSDAQTLPVTGTYTIVFDPAWTATGSTTLKLADASGDVTGTLAPTLAGSSAAISTTTGQNARFTFTGSAGQKVAVTTTDNTYGARPYVSLLKPDGSPLGNAVNTGFLDSTTLPVGGAYTLVVDPQGDDTGGATVTLYDVADVTASVAPSAAGAWTTVATTAPGQIGTLTFAGTAGQRVAFRESGNTVDNSVQIRKPDGSWLWNTFVSSASWYGFSDVQTLPVTGTYTVVFDPSGTQTGSARFGLYDVPPDPTAALTPSADGSSATLATTVPGQNASATFGATAGQKVSVVSSANTYTSRPYIKLLKPDGSQLGNQTNSGFVDSVTLPSSGTYTIVSDPQLFDTGSAKLTLYDAGDATGTLTPSAAGGSSSLSTVTPGQVGTVTFAGTSGQRVALRETGFNIDHMLQIKRPDGSTQWGPAFVGSQYTDGFSDAQTLPATGTYTITFDPIGMATGSTRLTVWDIGSDVSGALSLSNAGASANVTTLPGQNAQYTFAGTAGQKISLTATRSTYPSKPVVSIVRPDGINLVSPQASSFIDQTTLPTSGTYKVVVDPQTSEAGGLALGLYDAADASGAIAIGGPTVTAAATAPGQNARYTFSGTAGTAVRLTLSDVSAPANVSLIRPDGSNEVYPTYVDTAGRTISATLASSGAYTILVDPQNAETTTLRMTLTNPPPGSPKLAVHAGASAHTQHLTHLRIHHRRRPTKRWRKLPPLRAGRGVTAVAGQALNLDGTPIAGVRLSIDGSRASARTDRTGRFLLRAPRAGRRVLTIDGGPAATGRTRYGTFTAGVSVRAGVTNVLPYATWLPRLDRRSKVDLHYPLKRAVTLRTRRIPGLEVRIPAGSVVRDSHGRRLHRLTVTPIPVHQPPFPLPRKVKVPVYFTIQPGGAYLSKGAELIYPNPGHIAPRSRVNFWTYDPEQRGWFVYGRGTVSADGSHIVPDRGVRIWELSGAMIGATVIHPKLATLAGDSFWRDIAGSARFGARAVGDATPPRHAAPRTRSTRSRPVQIAHISGLPRRTSDPPTWTPNRENRHGDWRTHRTASPWTEIQPLKAANSHTAIAGQALTLDGLPLPGVTVSIEGANTSARTDGSGRFLLDGVTAGHRVVVIDGRSANRAGVTYGQFEYGFDVAGGRTNALDFPIWMTQLDHAGDSRVAAPTRRDEVLTNPKIPGLEVRIPNGSLIHDASGHLVRDLNLTQVPVDRAPFPLPKFVDAPTYFTVQPGRAYLSKGAQIIYPNYAHRPPGQRVDFWNYDAKSKGWYVYGRGTVTPDGKQVMPDPGVRVWEFTGAMINGSPAPPIVGPHSYGPPPGGNFGPQPGHPGPWVGPPCPCGPPPSGGDPVDLATGLFVHHQTDMYLPDTIPVELTRTYRQSDSNSYSFGLGTTSIYDMRLWSIHNYRDADFVTPSGGRVHYIRTSPGTGYTDAVYTAQDSPGAFFDSTISWNSSDNGWNLKLKDGTTYVFGEMAPLQAIRDRYGNQLTITRSAGGSGNITQITTPHGRWIKFGYDNFNRITSALDNSGRSVSYTYDGSGRLQTATDVRGGVTTYGYDASNDMTTIKNPRNLTYVTTSYDANGRVKDQTMPDGGVYHFEYTLDASGNVTKTRLTDPRGAVHEQTFDGAGYATSDVRDAGGPAEQRTSYTRASGTNLLSSKTDQLGRTTSYQYDGLGNVTQVTRLAGTADAASTTYTYEPKYSQVATATDPLGHTTTFGYDAQGNQTFRRDATGRTTAFGSNGAGQIASVTDPQGHTTALDYSSGLLSSVRDPLGHKTQLFSDAAGRTTAMTDALGNVSRYGYNAAGQLTSSSDPTGAQTSFTYDPDGNLSQVTDARGHYTSYTYDPLDRPATKTDPLNHTTSYVYDLGGNPIQRTQRNGQVDDFSYDALNRLHSATLGGQTTLTLGYDGADRLTSAASSSGDTTANGYDGLDRLSSQSGPNGSISYGYDAAGRRTSMTVAGQPTVTYGYDDANRATSVSRPDASAAMTYDSAGRRSMVTLPNGDTEQYTYDAASHLTAIDYGPGLGSVSYAYDRLGRREAQWGSVAHTDLPPALGSATYNDANQRVAENGTTLTYDADGNLTSDGTRTYTWNALGELATLSAPATTASFSYDALGRRTSRTVNGTTTGYLNDGDSVVQELSAGAPSANVLNGPRQDEVLARLTLNGISTHLTDALGSTVALANSTGAVMTSYSYDPFGSPTLTGAQSDDPFQFTGRENDGTGLQYNRARYYSPSRGTFISQDPIGLRGSGPTPYKYANDDPVNRRDPSGLDPGGNHDPCEHGGDNNPYLASAGGHTQFASYSPGGSSQMADCPGPDEHNPFPPWPDLSQPPGPQDPVPVEPSRPTVPSFPGEPLFVP
jgi:RHS repeat-associated protein